MPNRATVRSYEEDRRLASSAARTRDSYQFAGHIRDAVEKGFNPNQLNSSERSLLSEAEVEFSSLVDLFNKLSPSQKPNTKEPRIDEPVYSRPDGADPELFADRVLRVAYKPFGSFPPADWEIRRRIGEAHKRGIGVHNYSHLKGRELKEFWNTLVSKVSQEVGKNHGTEFVHSAREKYRDDPYA